MNDLHVVFRVGDSTYVLPAEAVIQMDSFTGATPVPGTVPHVAGLVQVRGVVVPVIDLRVRFGLPKAAPVLDSRVIVVERENRRVGLLVDSAREVARIDQSAFAPAPEVVSEQSARFVTAVARVGERLVMLIDCDRVIGEEAPDGN